HRDGRVARAVRDRRGRCCRRTLSRWRARVACRRECGGARRGRRTHALALAPMARRRVRRGGADVRGVRAMTSSAWADATLVAVLPAPLASVALVVVVAIPNAGQRWTTIGCSVAAAGSAVLLVTGQHPRVSRLAPDDLALVAMVAIALLALGLRVA